MNRKVLAAAETFISLAWAFIAFAMWHADRTVAMVSLSLFVIVGMWAIRNWRS